MTTYTFTRKEELVHAITHGVGIFLSKVAFIVLLIFALYNGDFWHLLSATIFGSTMLFMYLASTISHALPAGKLKDFFQIIDHSAIYLFIAGTYTPILLIPLRGDIGWTLFIIVWGIAVLGIIFKIFFVKRFLVLSTLFYILMGWLITIVWEPLANAMPQNGLTYLVIGGLLYTVGAVFYVWRKFHFHHAIWHIFVLAGSACHFISIFCYVM